MPEDAENLSELISKNAATILRQHYSDQQWEVFIRYYSPAVMLIKIRKQDIFCAMLNDELTGTIALEKDFVVGFYTAIAHLNKGVGKVLMRHLEEFALAKGITQLQLAASPEGVTFYYKNGWEKVKNITMTYLEVGFEETLMIKKLK